MKPTTEMMKWLREIVSKKPWNEDDLADWAGQFLAIHEDNAEERRREQSVQEEQMKIRMLKPKVSPYHHASALPTLPRSPDGQLHGIGFIYDEDRDDRVLIAIDQLKDHVDIIAVAEHEGELMIFTRKKTHENNIEVCGDTWVITELLPYQGRWSEDTEGMLEIDLA
jgi:hypothetical protein